MKLISKILLFVFLFSCKNQTTLTVNDSQRDSTNINKPIKKSFEYIKRDSAINGVDRQLIDTLKYLNKKYYLFINGKALNTYENDSSFKITDIKLFKLENENKIELEIEHNVNSKFQEYRIEDLDIRNDKNKSFEKSLTNAINFCDYNFDGYPDLGILLDGGVISSNYVYYTWINNPSTNEFKLDTLLSSLTIQKVDSTNKTITLYWSYGFCDNITITYKVKNNEYIFEKQIISYAEKDSTGEIQCKEKVITKLK